MDRRNFIKLTAITGTSGVLASCGNPENVLIRFVPDENVDLEPGIAELRPSVCPLCTGGCGITARVMRADAQVVRNDQLGVVRIEAAKKLDGTPEHPINQGRLCARGQAAIQVTYHPDRITQPLRRVGAPGEKKYEAVSWPEAIAEVVAQLDDLANTNNQGATTFLVGGGRSHRRLLIDQFLASLGGRPAVEFELFGNEVLRRANLLSFGHAQLPTLDLTRANYVLSLGSDTLGTWNSPVAQSVAYGAMRQGRPGIRGSLVQAEARMSQTGANADEWIPTRPGTEGALALGLAHVIMAEGFRTAADAGQPGLLINGWTDGLPQFTPEEVESLTGVPAARIQRLAREFALRAPAVAVIAGPPLAHTNGLFAALTVNALNALVGAIEQPGGIYFMPQLDGTTVGDTGERLENLTAEILTQGNSPVQALFIDGTNPVHAAPPGWRVREAIERVPFIVSFSSFLDETSELAHLILPDHTFLESWVDALPESGALESVASVAGPTMQPLHDTRAATDVLLEISRSLQQQAELPLPDSFEAMLEARFSRLPVDSGNAWRVAQAQGGWWGTLPQEAPISNGAPPDTAERGDRIHVFAAPEFDGDATDYPFHFLPYPSQAFLDGSLAHLPWLQEMPDPLTSAMWSSWVEINPKTAKRLGINDGDVVEIASAHGTLHTPALIYPGIAPDVVAMPVGQGHINFTRYATNRGANPVDVLAPVSETETGAPAWAATRVRVTRIGDPDGRLILMAGHLREDPNEETAR
jgi:anaerobic selenocysteine-containing dehydrogenase